MTEKEKMIAGMIYDANYDEELLRERTKAKELCHEYNYLVKKLVKNKGIFKIANPLCFCVKLFKMKLRNLNKMRIIEKIKM